MAILNDLTPGYAGEGQPKAATSNSLFDLSGLFGFFERLLGFPKTPEYAGADVLEGDGGSSPIVEDS